MSSPKLVFPNGVTPKTARRLADIADALEPFGVVALVDPNLYELDPPHCDGCGCCLEAGHCYCCFPVMGYGDRFQETRHGKDFRPSFHQTAAGAAPTTPANAESVPPTRRTEVSDMRDTTP